MLRVARKPSGRRALNLANFLAQREEIINALSDGWPLYQIWETLHVEKKFNASYGTFRNLVGRVLPGSGQAPAEVAQHRNSNSKNPARPAGFVFSPTPNDEDIL